MCAKSGVMKIASVVQRDSSVHSEGTFFNVKCVDSHNAKGALPSRYVISGDSSDSGAS